MSYAVYYTSVFPVEEWCWFRRGSRCPPPAVRAAEVVDRDTLTAFRRQCCLGYP